VQDFAQVIGHGATLWFIGDSVTEQMTSSLVCTMRAGGFTVVKENFGKTLRAGGFNIVKSMYCIIMTFDIDGRRGGGGG
jgi:hypothetical protein